MEIELFTNQIFRVFHNVFIRQHVEKSNWDLAVYRSRNYSKEYGTVGQFADTRQKLVYAHSKTEISLKGSINELRSAMLMGRRIQFQPPDSLFFTTGADYVVIKMAV